MQQAHERNDNLLEEVTRLTGSLQKNIKEAEVGYTITVILFWVSAMIWSSFQSNRTCFDHFPTQRVGDKFWSQLQLYGCCIFDNVFNLHKTVGINPIINLYALDRVE